MLRLQPTELADGTLPYPYFIDAQGLVGRQDFWKGKPYRLLGFNDTSTPGDIKLMRKDFLANPQKAVGMYPVFTSTKGEWVTQTVPIDRVGGQI